MRRVLLHGCLLLAMAGCGGAVVFDGSDEGRAGIGEGAPGTVASCDAELHLIGVYETHGNHGGGNHPMGAAKVHVERQGSFILALSSYEPVSWTVTAEPGAIIEKVIINGYHDQKASVPAGVPVEIYSGPGTSLGAYGYAWPSSEGGSDTQGLVKALESLTGRPLSSFHGCYQADSFVLHGDLSGESSCSTQAGYTHTSYVADSCDQ